MRSWIVLVIALLACSDAKRDKPAAAAKPAPIHVDRLLDEARARARATMGVQSLTIAGVHTDGQMDPVSGWLKIEWQERTRGDIEQLGADVPCVTLVWSAAAGWSQDPATTCKALGRPGVGYATLGLPRCTVAKVLELAWVEARKVSTAALRYAPKLPVSNGTTVEPNLGHWAVTVDGGSTDAWSGDDECPARQQGGP